MAVRALVIQADGTRRQRLVDTLTGLGVPAQVAGSAEAGRALLDEQVALLCVDLCLPGTSGAEFLAAQLAHSTERVVLVLAQEAHPDGGLQWLRRGAFDVLAGPIGDAQLGVHVARAVEQARLRAELRRLRADEDGAVGLAGIVGRSPPMRRVQEQVRQAGLCAMHVALVGERGVGKTLLARVIHALSARRHGPFLRFDARAVATEVLETLLFGGDACAGTLREHPAYLERAATGTLFLEGLQALPASVQERLARTLREGRLAAGHPARTTPLDVRVVTATLEDLGALAARGLVRDDLRRALSALTIHVPALRQRAQDVGELAYTFLDRHRADLGRGDRVHIAPETLALLERHAWPGNVGQLEGAIRHALRAVGPGSVLRPEALPPDVLPVPVTLPPTNGHAAHGVNGRAAPPSGEPGHRAAPSGFHDPETGELLPLRDIEEQAFRLALREHGGNTTRAARALGVARATFYRRLGPKKSA